MMGTHAMVTKELFAILVLILFTVDAEDKDIFKDSNQWCAFLPEAVKVNYPDCSAGKGKKANDVPKDNPMNDEKLFEGDILGIDITDSQETMTTLANSILDWKRHWKDGAVYYRISTSYDDAEQIKNLVQAAIKVFHENTCVKFEPRTTQVDYIQIDPGQGCSSFSGRQGGRQAMNINQRSCMTSGIIQHELMHAIGFHHEQSRSDRDNYVEINNDNIAQKNRPQFKKYSSAEVTHFGMPYDFGSVLHYKKNDFAIDPNVWTIRPKGQYEKEAVKMGQRNGLSKIDIAKINAMYNCTRPGPCPNSPAWINFESKCYFFSFLTSENPKNWVGSRNFCRNEHKAILATVSKSSIRKLFQNKMSENKDKFKGVRKVWLNDGKSLTVTSNEFPDNNSREWHFICSRNSATQEANFKKTE